MIFSEITSKCLLKADDSNPRNSDSAAIRCNDGAIMLVWQYFEGSERGSNDEAPCNISAMRSYDNGHTWGERYEIASDSDCINVYAPNLFKTKDGKIALIYHKNICFWEGKEVKASIMIKISEDDGRTFGEARSITDSLNCASVGSHAVIRSDSGRLILPVMVFTGPRCMPGENIVAKVLYSDNDGLSWSFSDNGAQLPMRGCLESYVAPYKDGTLVMVIRTQLGSMFKSYSFDDGVTWSKPQTTGLVAPESSPYITRIPNSDAMLVIWNNSEYDMHFNHFGKRTPLTIAVTYDGANTFTDITDIGSDPKGVYSNSTVFWVSDDELLVTYWYCVYTDNWLMTANTDLGQVRIKIDRSKLLK